MSLLKSTKQAGTVLGGVLTVTGMLGMVKIFTMGSADHARLGRHRLDVRAAGLGRARPQPGDGRRRHQRYPADLPGAARHERCLLPDRRPALPEALRLTSPPTPPPILPLRGQVGFGEGGDKAYEPYLRYHPERPDADPARPHDLPVPADHADRLHPAVRAGLRRVEPSQPTAACRWATWTRTAAPSARTCKACWPVPASSAWIPPPAAGKPTWPDWWAAANWPRRVVIPAGYSQSVRNGTPLKLGFYADPSQVSTATVESELLVASNRLASAVRTASIAAKMTNDPAAFDPALTAGPGRLAEPAHPGIGYFRRFRQAAEPEHPVDGAVLAGHDDPVRHRRAADGCQRDRQRAQDTLAAAAADHLHFPLPDPAGALPGHLHASSSCNSCC